MTQEEQKIQAWVSTLFNENEYTCMGDMYKNKVFPVGDIIKTHEYVSINPMKKGTTRKGINITSFRNFLFEMDELNKQEQAERIKTSGLPYSTIVDSGNKSLHFVLALEENVGDRSIYTAYFKAINAVLKTYGAQIDDACKDPGRFTRAPYGVNTKKLVVEQKPEIHKRVQLPLRNKGKIPNVNLDQWLEKHGVSVLDFIEVPTNRENYIGTHSDADAELKWDWIEKHYMKGYEYVAGSKHNYQIKMAYNLLRTGLTGLEIDALFIQKLGEISTGINSCETLTPDGDPIYVPTMEERRDYYKQQDEAAMRTHFRAGYERPNLNLTAIEARPEEINRFILVGTEYFKLDSLSDDLIPWTKTIFEKMYGGRAIPPLQYDKFGYKPDYLSEPFPYNLEVDEKTRNKFIRPTYKKQQGGFKTIESALRHGFGEQYDLILIWCAISIAFPEAKLPALYFLGPEDRGKTAVVYVFKALMGKHNTKKISSKQLESGYTDFLAASQLVIVEETGGWKDAEATMGDLKDWITDVGTALCNPKYGKQFESPINCKFLFTSNDFGGIPLIGEATRFWIREITEKPKNKVSNYYQQVDAEMGHFADFLIKEIVPKIKLNEDGEIDTTNRLYFAPEEYETGVKQFVKSLNKGQVYDSIMEVVGDHFEKFPTADHCYFDLKSIKEACGWKYKGDPSNTEIKLTLKQLFGVDQGNRLVREDSLRMEPYGIDKVRPERAASWYTLSRQQIIGDTLFNMESVKVS